MFYALAALLVFLCLALLAARRVVRAVLALLGVVVGLGFVYFLAGAEAAGAAQLLVYAGGVLVLLLFGVMTAQRPDPARGPLSAPTEWLSGGILAAVLLAVLARTLLPAVAAAEGTLPLQAYTGGTLAGAGQTLVAYHAAAFEWAALLLLLALAFAAPLAHRAGSAGFKD